MNRVDVRWVRGGEAAVMAVDAVRITLASSVPSAPGSPIEGRLQASGADVRVKVVRCRRREGGEEGFLIEGRLVDATREVRATLAGLVSGG